MRRLEIRTHLIETIHEHQRDRNPPKVNPRKVRKKLVQIPKRKKRSSHMSRITSITDTEAEHGE